jgi:hypothetical protein
MINDKPTWLSNNGRLPFWLDGILFIGIIIFIIGITFQLVIKQILPGPIGTYWKEILLGALLVIWIIRSFIARRFQIEKNILNYAILIYAAFIILRFFIDGATSVAAWGLYFSILYLPLVLLVPSIFTRYPKTLTWFLAGLVTLGGLVALGGVLEFILNRPLWPSVELTILQGFPDMYVYGTHLRRVYFVFDSPTTLANTLALLLPLSVYLFFFAHRIIFRIAYAIAAAMMFACILFTFSRGIWVAIAVAAVIVIIVKVLIEGNRKVLLAGLGIALVASVIFVTVQILNQTTTITNQSVFELPASLFTQVPTNGSQFSLMDITPEIGKAELQNWTLFDAIRETNESRTVVYGSPSANGPYDLIYRVTIPESGALLFSIAIDPKVWSPDLGDGVTFKIFLDYPQEQNSGKTVFLRYINPKSNPTDRRWRNYVLDLSEWSGQTINLDFILESGPQSNYYYDWAGWAGLQLASIPHSFIEANLPKPQNPIIEHMASISNWVKDATNQDRLLAWNIGISTWLKSPLWGNGLGTTGEAALRTIPGTGFVTESQLLKSLVELGIPGFISWAFLWVAIGLFSVRLYRQMNNQEIKMLVLGILASLTIIFIDGLVYQNLEVKQVNMLFWILTGILIYLHTIKPNFVPDEEEA